MNFTTHQLHFDTALPQQDLFKAIRIAPNLSQKKNMEITRRQVRIYR